MAQSDSRWWPVEYFICRHQLTVAVRCVSVANCYRHCQTHYSCQQCHCQSTKRFQRQKAAVCNSMQSKHYNQWQITVSGDELYSTCYHADKFSVTRLYNWYHQTKPYQRFQRQKAAVCNSMQWKHYNQWQITVSGDQLYSICYHANEFFITRLYNWYHQYIIITCLSF